MIDIHTVAGTPKGSNASDLGTSCQGPPHEEAGGRPKFGKDGGFQAEVRRRVEEFFRASGRRQRDCPRMYLKTAVILAWLVSSYALLVFVAAAWWQALALAVLLGLAITAVSFSIQHDGNHHAYSRHAWVNQLAAMSLDLVGASSYFWHWKHDVIHHTYANITGQDTDIDTDGLARLSPHQKRRKVHRWQHYYMWLLYGLMTVRWQLFGDFRDLAVGKVVDQKVPRPRGWDLVVLLEARAVEEAKRRRLTLVLAATILLALTLGGGGWLYVKNERDARLAQVTRDVNDALNQATARREQAKAAPTGGATLFAQAREQAQRALALTESGPADDTLKAQVTRLQSDLDEEDKDRKLVAALDEARLAQAEKSVDKSHSAPERAVPAFREAFRAYGLPAGEGEPAAAAERIGCGRCWRRPSRPKGGRGSSGKPGRTRFTPGGRRPWRNWRRPTTWGRCPCGP
jgi:hypothetical protein